MASVFQRGTQELKKYLVSRIEEPADDVKSKRKSVIDSRSGTSGLFGADDATVNPHNVAASKTLDYRLDSRSTQTLFTFHDAQINVLATRRWRWYRVSCGKWRVTVACLQSTSVKTSSSLFHDSKTTTHQPAVFCYYLYIITILVL